MIAIAHQIDLQTEEPPKEGEPVKDGAEQVQEQAGRFFPKDIERQRPGVGFAHLGPGFYVLQLPASRAKGSHNFASSGRTYEKNKVVFSRDVARLGGKVVKALPNLAMSPTPQVRFLNINHKLTSKVSNGQSTRMLLMPWTSCTQAWGRSVVRVMNPTHKGD